MVLRPDTGSFQLPVPEYDLRSHLHALGWFDEGLPLIPFFLLQAVLQALNLARAAMINSLIGAVVKTGEIFVLASQAGFEARHAEEENDQQGIE